MFASLKRLWDTQMIDLTALSKAVAKGWITTEQYDQIINNDDETATE